MNRSARVILGAAVILAGLTLHLETIRPAAATSAVILVVVTSGATTAVVAPYVSKRDAELRDIRRMLARMREDQIQAKERSEKLVVEDSDE
jgi:uncharacterized membrane protein